MIAERDNQKIRKQRDSALIVLANARLLESEGWQVVIVDDEGTDFDIAEFEAGPAQQVTSWFRPIPQQVEAPAAAADAEAFTEQDEVEAAVAAELAAEEREAHDVAAAELHELDEADFEGPAPGEIDVEDLELEDLELEDLEIEDQEIEDLELEESELEESELEAEPAE
jgi:hypothetical protein